MKQPPFLVTNYRGRAVDPAEHEHYGNCQFCGFPFVHVCKRGKRASISWDYKTLPRGVIDSLKAASAKVDAQICSAIGIRRAAAAPLGYYLAGFEENIDSKTAEIAAEEICEILMRHST